MKERRFYWIKLKTDFFNQETIDFLLSQQNGCQYIVLYQMLCLKTANNNGEMATRIGEMIVPYNINKIVRDTKYFDFDTVTVALELFKQLGLIYEEEDKILKITHLEEMVGSEAANANAQRQKRFRERQKLKELPVTNSNACNVTENNEEIEYRDKSIDIDKDIDIEGRQKADNCPPKTKKFKKPTIEEVKQYCLERNNDINAEQFIDYYEANGWKVGKNPMKDWKAAVRTWERRDTGKRKEIVPSWMNKEIKGSETKEDDTEFKDFINEFRKEEKQTENDTDFKLRVEKLKESLKR